MLGSEVLNRPYIRANAGEGGKCMCAVERTETKLDLKKLGEPLTLEQLRKMDGKPVWSAKHKEWFLICERPSRYMMYDRNGFCLPVQDVIDYGLYAYPPAHIDREVWEPCELCSGDKLDGVGFGDRFGLRIYLNGGNGKPPENERFQYCPKCGRPLTEEAWAMLENRFRG